MKSDKIKKIIAKLPDSSGVYFFKKGNRILYVGKATSLRDRVKSYMSKTVFDTRGPLIEKMLREFDDIKFIKTDSVLEALILEANLIKKHQPLANIKEKDDRSFNYVVITEEDFPRVLVMRGREIEKFFKSSSENFSSPHSSKSTDIFLLKNSSCSPQSGSQGFSQKDGSKNFLIRKIFGPFPNGLQLKEAIKIVRKMFPFRDKCALFFPSHDEGEGRVGFRPCFNRQIGLCPGVCTGEITKKEYAKQIKNIVLFFEGKKKKLVKKLQKQMKTFSNSREFENAQKIKKQIFALGHIQDISLVKDEVSKGTFDTLGGSDFRIESYDVAHLSGTNMVGVMVVIESGELKKSDYRKFKIRSNKSIIKNSSDINDTKALAEILNRRLNHSEWLLPNLIVVDGGRAQKNVMEKVLKQKNIKIPVVSVVKDKRHKPKKILGMNHESGIKNYNWVEKNLNKYERDILLSNAEAHRFAISFHRKLFHAKMGL